MIDVIRTGGAKLFRAAFAVIVLLASILAEPFERAFRMAMRHATLRRYALPRVYKFSQHQFVKRGKARILAGGAGFRIGLALAALVLIALGVFTAAAHAGGAALAIGAAASTRSLEQITTEMKELQEKFRGKAMPQAEGEKFDALAIEGKAMQDELDRDAKIKAFDDFDNEPAEISLPGTREAKGGAPKGSPDEVVGFFSMGQAFVNSPQYKALRDAGFPMEATTVAQFDGVSRLGKGTQRVLPVTRKQYAELMERKAVATVGAGVIRPMRESEVVRAAAAEFDTLTIRDLVNVSPTDSPSIEYISFDTLTRAAAPVAESAAKPEATFATSLVTVPVRTLAVTMPVTEQQLQDIPQMQNLIDEELTYDLKKHEEEQMVWGRGTGQNLLGIMKTPGVVAARTLAGSPTLLDEIRAAITDVAVNGRVTANGLAIHPYDRETVELLKGTDLRYVWAVVTDNNGNARIWGLRVVETIAMTDVLDAVNTTKQRVCIVGDFKRGATLWDRQQANTAIGWINDQFTKNQRTVRVEERVAFGVKRPKAFAYIQTVAAAA